MKEQVEETHRVLRAVDEGYTWSIRCSCDEECRALDLPQAVQRFHDHALRSILAARSSQDSMPSDALIAARTRVSELMPEMSTDMLRALMALEQAARLEATLPAASTPTPTDAGAQDLQAQLAAVGINGGSALDLTIHHAANVAGAIALRVMTMRARGITDEGLDHIDKHINDLSARLTAVRAATAPQQADAGADDAERWKQRALWARSRADEADAKLASLQASHAALTQAVKAVLEDRTNRGAGDGQTYCRRCEYPIVDSVCLNEPLVDGWRGGVCTMNALRAALSESTQGEVKA